MANTKKDTTTTTVSTAAKTVRPTVDEEKEALKAKLAEQEKQMAEMMAQMRVMMQAQAATNIVEQEDKASKSIKFISLVTGGLNLRGNRMYHIDHQFGYKMIPESEARAIISNMPNTVASGMVYIADKDFVEKHDLDGAYEEILSDKQLRELLNNSADVVCDIFKNASSAQKQIILDMIINRKINNEPIDANILVEIGKLSGKNLMDIEPLDDKE